MSRVDWLKTVNILEWAIFCCGPCQKTASQGHLFQTSGAWEEAANMQPLIGFFATNLVLNELYMLPVTFHIMIPLIHVSITDVILSVEIFCIPVTLPAAGVWHVTGHLPN